MKAVRQQLVGKDARAARVPGPNEDRVFRVRHHVCAVVPEVDRLAVVGRPDGFRRVIPSLAIELAMRRRPVGLCGFPEVQGGLVRADS